MPRSTTFTANNQTPIKQNIEVRRAETLRLTLTPAGVPMAITIALTPGGVPLVEIPSEAIGSFFIISPEKVSVLEEGRSYRMNIWNVEDPNEPILLVEGQFTTANTIQPSFVQYATQYFEGGSIVILTSAQYDALQTYDPNAVYVFVEE